ncbi:hypothetical protein [Pseudoxanthomonas winnipegensis]|uniref:Uncharacterized protein n=1 Tax=Pseudoxanthomonas winnipegensis TaxID=2480810 RepID=A0A4Q8M850_9GAMM|nr:hypothetical protein [Pseudoxanthomonas winnipegensis]TAA46282.1 hypothetical protein EA655_00875 [Pseudoxanthomonas winnipegensis]
MADSVVQKYMACTAFDDGGNCTAAVWVDPPAVIPPMSAEMGAGIGSTIGLIWLAVYAVTMPRKGAQLRY